MKKRILNLLPYVFPFIFIVLASVKLMYPGINYDEIFWGNAALGGLDETFIKRIAGIPIFIHDYIGALKPWFYMPIFMLFGVSVITIRLPMILIMAGSLFLLYKTSSLALGRKTGLVTLIISSIDASLIAHARVDYGPVVFSYLFRVLALLLLFKFLRTKQWRYIFMLIGVFVLGFFNKFDYIWFINGILVSSLLLFRDETYGRIWKSFSRNFRFLMACLTVISFAGGFCLLAKIGFFRYIDFFYFSHLISVIKGTFHLINGQSFYNYMIGNSYTVFGSIYSLAALAVVGSIILKKLLARKPEDKNILFLFSVMAFTFFQIVITNRSGASWHLIYAYPIFHILLAASIISISKNGRYWVVIAVFVIASYQLFTYTKYIRAYDIVMKNPQWSKAIYELIGYTKQTKDRFVSVDWGTHNQLLVFNGVKGRFFDEWVWFIKDPLPQNELDRLLDSYYGQKDVVFITYTAKKSNFSRTRNMFFKICDEYGYRPYLTRIIKDDGETVFELYKTRKLAQD